MELVPSKTLGMVDGRVFVDEFPVKVSNCELVSLLAISRELEEWNNRDEVKG